MDQKMIRGSKAYRFKRFVNKAYSAFNSMHKVVNIGVISCCTLTFAHSTQVSAQSHSGNENHQKLAEKELDEVMVTASRVEMAINQVPKLVTVITRSEIERAPIQSIQDLLNYAVGIDVQQRGGHGVQADISIRGGSFDQTAILLNGVNLSNPQTGHFSFDIPINLSDIERLEIIHGPSSIIYGASAFSGGINIITKKNPDHKAYAKLEAGGHGLLGAELSGAYTKKDVVSTQLSAGYKKSDGYMPNSDYDILNLLWQTRLSVDDKSKLDFQAGYSDKQYGANTFYSAAYPNQYDKTKSYFASVRGETGNQLKFIPQFYWSRHDDCFQLIREGTPEIPSWYKGHNYHQTDVYGSNLNLQYRTEFGITSLGAEIRNEGIKSNVLGVEMSEPQGRYTKSDNRTNISYALEHTLLLNDLSLTAGLLANYNTALRDKYRFYPSINIGYQLLDDLKIYVSWNKATRMPTFTDLYYTTATHIGNYLLKPEDSESYEVGFKYNTPFAKAYLSAYAMKGTNLIDWVKIDPDDKWESKNLTKINKKGIDVGAHFYLHRIFFQLNPQAIVQVGYTRLHQNKNSNEYISNYALNYLRDKFITNVTYPIHKNVILNLNFRWQKRMGTYLLYEDLKPTVQTPFSAFSTIDMKVNWLIKDFNLSLIANNILDKKYIDLGNVPQSGFWLIGGISYTLK